MQGDGGSIRRPIGIYGAGGHGKVVADVARSSGREVVAFVDDDAARRGTALSGAPVLGWADLLARRGEWTGLELALGIGDNAARMRSFDRAKAAGLAVATLVHASAVVSPSASLGEGTVVMPGAIVNADARVGRGVVVNTGSIVEHDCRLGDFVFVSPGAALGGASECGASAHIGIGAAVLPLVKVGAGSRIGAGAVVIVAVPADETWVGVPARQARKSE
jgi:sugar O-acyltransferase (sialic acid O-acetyltransferase NeuD family)